MVENDARITTIYVKMQSLFPFGLPLVLLLLVYYYWLCGNREYLTKAESNYLQNVKNAEFTGVNNRNCTDSPCKAFQQTNNTLFRLHFVPHSLHCFIYYPILCENELFTKTYGFLFIHIFDKFAFQQEFPEFTLYRDSFESVMKLIV